MFRIRKIKFKKIGAFFKKLPKILAEKAFLTFLVLLFLVLILGGLIFYQYNILVKKIEPQISEKPLQLKEKTFEDILKIWQEKEKRFNEAGFKIYPDPFKL